MTGARARWLTPALAALVTLAFAAAGLAFVVQPTLATFADDSVSYLVMAQVFSPWQAASAPVAEAFAREAFYPPLFPLILALAGAAHDVARAHAVTELLLAACLPLAWLLGGRWLGSRGLALAATLAIALLPSLWINAKGILSEPLFCLALLGTLYALDSDARWRGRTLSLALLMAALVLTRTVGLALVAAYALWGLTRRDLPEGRLRTLAPVLAAMTAYAVWVAIRPAATVDSNAQALMERGRDFLGAHGGAGALLALLQRQADAMLEAWIGSLLVYWIAGIKLRTAFACAVGLLALLGLARRFAQGRPDAWMLAAYLLTYLGWPYHDQMERFIFPALPVLVLYAFYALAGIGRRAAALQALLALLLLSLAVPALAFVHQRAQAQPYAAITDWYRKPDLAEALERARTQLDLLADMDEIRKLTRPEDQVMWVAPSYVALLADRRAVPAPAPELDPDAYRAAVRASQADYVFLSLYHPRDTIHDTAWQAGVRALTGHAKVVHARTREGQGIVTGLLLKVDRAGAVSAALERK